MSIGHATPRFFLALWMAFTGIFLWIANSISERINEQAETVSLERAKAGATAVQLYSNSLMERMERIAELARDRQSHIDREDAVGARSHEERIRNLLQSGGGALRSVSIVNPDGSSRWSMGLDNGVIDHSDQEYFTELSNGQNNRAIGLLTAATAQPEQQFYMAHTFQNCSGSTRYIMVFFIDGIEISRALDKLEIGRSSTQTLLRLDGLVLARSKNPLLHVGKTLQASDMHRQAVMMHPQIFAGKLISGIDGRERLVSHVAVPNSPLIASVGLDRTEELSPFRFAKPVLVGSAAIISLLMLLFSTALFLFRQKKETEEKLNLARKEAEDSREVLIHTQRMEALGRLSGGIAHDINNVLQAVLAAAQSIRRRTKDESILRLIKLLEETTSRGAGITRRLLMFARRGQLQKEDVNPGELLTGLQEVLSHTLGKSIRVTVETFGTLPNIFTDKSQLETVLINLAVNGRDAMLAKEGGTLTIRAKLDVIEEPRASQLFIKPGSYVCFSVSDTGEGMSLETLQRATEPFFTTKPKDRGTGLGLSMAKGFAEQSAGAFMIASALGEGTTVTLWLPCNDSLAHEQARDLSGEADDHAPLRREGEPIRILIVDDEAIIRGLMRDGLISLGWVIEDAANGKDALAALQKEASFDVLITDLSMPCMDGLSLIRAARKLSPGLPALLVTAHAGQAHTTHLARAAAAGPFAVVNKPASPDEIAAHVETLMQQQGRAQRADASARGAGGGGRRT